MTSIFSSEVDAVWCNVQETTNSTEQNVSCECDSKYAGQDINHLYDIRKFIAIFTTILYHELFDSRLRVYRVALRCIGIALYNLSISPQFKRIS
jgi:hypothetical protein